MKKFLIITIFGTILLSNFGQHQVLAQNGEGGTTEYELLAPLPGYVEPEAGGKVKAGPYIAGIFTLTIAIAGVLAVLKIIFGGIKYMSTDAFSGKNEAKDTIQNAIWGLLLAISAWLILHTINPKLTEFDLSIPVQNISDSEDGGGGR